MKYSFCFTSLFSVKFSNSTLYRIMQCEAHRKSLCFQVLHILPAYYGATANLLSRHWVLDKAWLCFWREEVSKSMPWLWEPGTVLVEGSPAVQCEALHSSLENTQQRPQPGPWKSASAGTVPDDLKTMPAGRAVHLSFLGGLPLSRNLPIAYLVSLLSLLEVIRK